MELEDAHVLTLKWYLLTAYPHPKITAMRTSSKSRIKPLIPKPIRLGLSSVALLTVALVLVAPALRAQSNSEGALTVAEQYLLVAANQDRAAQGLPALHLDPVLSQASAFHAEQMASHATISHQFPDEPALATRGSNAGVHFSLITENVGEAPTSVIIHNLWMHSPGHRANLLDPNVDSIGIAIVTRDNQLYAVEDFASTVETLTLNQQERTVANVLSKSGMRVADTTPDARQTCAMPTGYAGSRQPWFIMRYTASTLSELPTQLKTKLTSGKYHQAVVGACSDNRNGPFTAYNIAVLLYP
jgi:uncharacterized protein YkwD